GTVVAVIAAPGETVGAAPAAAPRPAAPPGAVSRQRGPAPGDGSGERGAVPSVATPADPTRVKASPLARRIAKEAGVDLKLVTGSGPGGRVVKKDLERAPTTAPAAPFPVSRVPFPDRPGTPYEDIPLNQIRKTIAKRLATSLGPIPHFFLTSEVDMERAAEAREALNQQIGEQAAGKVSFNDIVIKATGLGLA